MNDTAERNRFKLFIIGSLMLILLIAGSIKTTFAQKDDLKAEPD